MLEASEKFEVTTPRSRLGAVSYLNTKPLIAALDDRLPAAWELVLDLPSRLADRLADGEIDVGLIPVVEYFRRREAAAGTATGADDYRILSDACIACRGNVRSVRLLFRRPPSQVRTLAVDEGSRTSAVLAMILLRERAGVVPEVTPLWMTADPETQDADAILLIGDRAMHPDRFRMFHEQWDLGGVWWEHTGLPFVFAVWVGRNQSALDGLAEVLSQARDAGLLQLRQLSQLHAAGYGLTVDECYEYFSRHLQFTLTAEARRGLEVFHSKALAYGLIEPPASLPLT